jgi:hypothetical protein
MTQKQTKQVTKKEKPVIGKKSTLPITNHSEKNGKKDSKLKTSKIVKSVLTTKLVTGIENDMLAKIKKDGKVLRLIGRDTKTKHAVSSTSTVQKRPPKPKKK